MAKKRINPLDTITQRIIQQLEKGVVPWRPSHICRTGIPTNFKTKARYQGINYFSLGMLHYQSPWFLTYNQAKELGGNVKKGEKGNLVIKVGQYKKTQKNPLTGENEIYQAQFRKGYYVFNASQIEGIDFPETDIKNYTESLQTFDCQEAKKLIASSAVIPSIYHGNKAIPCYIIEKDHIEMPDRSYFKSQQAYYHDLFHEIIHSTGHKNRLNRASLYDRATKGIGTRRDAKGLEELIAEMGSCILSTETGIMQDIDPEYANSAAYIESWLSTLTKKDSEYWIPKAASYAQKAVDYVRANKLDLK